MNNITCYNLLLVLHHYVGIYRKVVGLDDISIIINYDDTGVLDLSRDSITTLSICPEVSSLSSR